MRDGEAAKSDGLQRHRTRTPAALFKRLLRERKGAAAIEFAILAIPFLMVIFASIETFVAFTGEQLLSNATDAMARKIRTGSITNVMTEQEFRRAFCEEIAVMMPCSSSELVTPSKLYIDVRSFTDFSQIPTAVPRVGSDTSDLDISGFRYAPGGTGTINIVRAYYRWTVITDLVRPFVTGLRPAGTTMPHDYLMVATSAFRNEAY